MIRRSLPVHNRTLGSGMNDEIKNQAETLFEDKE